MSIIEALKKIENEKLTSFHVPGHKNGRLLEGLPFGQGIAAYDTTEIPGTDNLHAPEDCILHAEKNVAKFYGSLESFFLVNGTTCGLISMIYAAFKPGDKVIISRDAHKAVFTGMILAGVDPVYVAPEVNKVLGISLGITKEIIERAYNEHDGIKGLIVTYPNYHGICTNLEEIESFVHGQGGILLVDGAHGAHLNLDASLPKSAIACGADIVVHSTHKSLAALTQSSILHYCTERVSLSRLKMALTMFQSSSPSYLLMASLENAVTVARDEGQVLMATLLEEIQVFKKHLESNTAFELLDRGQLLKSVSLDRTKITLLTSKTKVSGGDIEQVLRMRYGIQCEYATDSAILFITSIATTKEDLDRLLKALLEISQEIQSSKIQLKTMGEQTNYGFKQFTLKSCILPAQAVHMERESCPLSEAIGEIAGDFIVPYPPGVPIVVPGEIISEDLVNYIEEGCRKGYNINGVYKDKTLRVNIIRR